MSREDERFVRACLYGVLAMATILLFPVTCDTVNEIGRAANRIAAYDGVRLKVESARYDGAWEIRSNDRWRVNVDGVPAAMQQCVMPQDAPNPAP